MNLEEKISKAVDKVKIEGMLHILPDDKDRLVASILAIVEEDRKGLVAYNSKLMVEGLKLFDKIAGLEQSHGNLMADTKEMDE